VLLDSSLYFHGAILGFDEPYSYQFFSSSHGLRQGDPLSPLLFVIVVNALGKMLYVVVSRGQYYGFSMRTGTNLSHLLFTDDNLIFSGADPYFF
jgi:hypothetical protein